MSLLRPDLLIKQFPFFSLSFIWFPNPLLRGEFCVYTFELRKYGEFDSYQNNILSRIAKCDDGALCDIVHSDILCTLCHFQILNHGNHQCSNELVLRNETKLSKTLKWHESVTDWNWIKRNSFSKPNLQFVYRECLRMSISLPLTKNRRECIFSFANERPKVSFFLFDIHTYIGTPQQFIVQHYACLYCVHRIVLLVNNV